MPTVLTGEEREQVVENLEQRVLKWTNQLCDSLAENYKQYHVDMLNRNVLMDKHSEYAQQQLDDINNGCLLYTSPSPRDRG